MAETDPTARGAAIEYYNRHTGRVEVEQIYGEGALRWAYESPLGRLTTWALVRRAWFSRWYGWRMRQAQTRARVPLFIEKYGLDPAEFARPAGEYGSFDDFFSRELRAGARPLEGGPETVVFGADARHLGFPDVAEAAGVFVKGQKWDLPGLLGDAELARKYAHGTLVMSRLCPVDYHRFHFPTAGTPGAARLLEGSLWSVNPIALRRKLAWVWENRRGLTVLETPNLGRVLLLEIGATNVGSITQTFTPGRPVERGAEKGYFSFGGSATILLFEPGRVRLAEDLVAQTRAGRELYARMGTALAERAG